MSSGLHSKAKTRPPGPTRAAAMRVKSPTFAPTSTKVMSRTQVLLKVVDERRIVGPSGTASSAEMEMSSVGQSSRTPEVVDTRTSPGPHGMP